MSWKKREREKQPLVNWQIRYPQVRVVSEDGKNLGVVPTKKAIFMAKDEGKDLVLVAEKANPPVAKIIDFGKFKYQLEKNKKSEKASELKTIRLRLNISDHDLETKLNKAKEFLEKKDRVKISLMLFGREMQFQDRARELLEEVVEKLSEKGAIETPITKSGRIFFVQIKPKT